MRSFYKEKHQLKKYISVLNKETNGEFVNRFESTESLSENQSEGKEFSFFELKMRVKKYLNYKTNVDEHYSEKIRVRYENDVQLGTRYDFFASIVQYLVLLTASLSILVSFSFRLGEIREEMDVDASELITSFLSDLSFFSWFFIGMIIFFIIALVITIIVVDNNLLSKGCKRLVLDAIKEVEVENKSRRLDNYDKSQFIEKLDKKSNELKGEVESAADFLEISKAFMSTKQDHINAQSYEDIMESIDIMAHTLHTISSSTEKFQEIKESLIINNIEPNTDLFGLLNIDKLEGIINQVSSSIDIVVKISKRTKILAINASIEASRAGESGRGFAIVADEVAKLSDESSATSRIIANSVSELVNHVSDWKTQSK